MEERGEGRQKTVAPKEKVREKVVAGMGVE